MGGLAAALNLADTRPTVGARERGALGVGALWGRGRVPGARKAREGRGQPWCGAPARAAGALERPERQEGGPEDLLAWHLVGRGWARPGQGQ